MHRTLTLILVVADSSTSGKLGVGDYMATGEVSLSARSTLRFLPVISGRRHSVDITGGND